MSAFNVVRFRVKPGKEEAFLEAHRSADWKFKGSRKASVIKTGERSYCVIGEWDNQAAIVEARPMLIGMLNSFRDTLEDLGGGMGVTDPISGETVLELR
ncbi:MAG: antibiotic biosynthesis monooxygenase [Bdellovibrionota bacterium]